MILVGNYNAGQTHHYGRMLMEELNPFIDSETAFCRMRGTPASVILGWTDWSN